MVEHDDHVGMLLQKLEDLGIADNTIVIYSTDNGAETLTWPDGGITPFKGEKGTTWEGGFRVPLVVRWPGVIEPGTTSNDIISQEDWMPTLMAAIGEPDIAEKLKQGHTANGKEWKVHLDGYNFLPRFKGEAEKGPRDQIFYFSQGGELNAVRWNDWKIHFATIEGNIATGVREVAGWPKIINLRADPYEHAWEESEMYIRWMADNMWLFVPIQAEIQKFLTTMDGYPFQEGQSLNASGINYRSLKALKILEQIKEKGLFERPGN
jgi:arylsulfatase